MDVMATRAARGAANVATQVGNDLPAAALCTGRTRPLRLGLVDERAAELQRLQAFFAADPRFEIVFALESALVACVRTSLRRPDIVLMNANLAGYSAMDASRLMKQMYEPPRVVLLGRSAERHCCRSDPNLPDAVVPDPRLDEQLVELMLDVTASKL